ncbi:MAG: Uma2 family endonuclease [Pirellulales bacterium]
MATIANITTADELLKHASELGRSELVRGELLMMSPVKSPHGIVTLTVGAILHGYVRKKRLGVVFGAETGFYIERNPDTVRAPDVGFVHKHRLKRPLPDGFYPGAPDLAVEVLSPSDRSKEVKSKVAMWLSTGCRLVWVVDPKKRTVVVHEPAGRTDLLAPKDEITGGEVLPGFRTRIAEFFVDLDVS